MLSTKFAPWHPAPFAVTYARLRLTRRPVLVHFEVTMRCNASCSFCDYWKTSSAMKAREATSFDYLDERHDRARGISGLAARIRATAESIRAMGMTLRFNTDFENGNLTHLIRRDQGGRVEALVAELLAFKRRRRGIISNSDHYLANIPRYLRGEMREPCRSGQDTVHVDPYGGIRRCPDFPTDGHWSEYGGYDPIACDRCYYACRGEAQAPLRLNRFRDLVATA